MSDPRHPLAVGAMERLRFAGHELCIVPQSLYEFWVVATRPVDRGGLDLSVEEAGQEVGDLRDAFTLLDDDHRLLETWLNLVSQHACRGKPAHDARIAAAMMVHDVFDLLTFNAADFRRYALLRIHEPATASVSM